jgi:hypothetical protein
MLKRISFTGPVAGVIEQAPRRRGVSKPGHGCAVRRLTLPAPWRPGLAGSRVTVRALVWQRRWLPGYTDRERLL